MKSILSLLLITLFFSTGSALAAEQVNLGNIYLDSKEVVINDLNLGDGKSEHYTFNLIVDRNTPSKVKLKINYSAVNKGSGCNKMKMVINPYTKTPQLVCVDSTPYEKSNQDSETLTLKFKKNFNKLDRKISLKVRSYRGEAYFDMKLGNNYVSKSLFGNYNFKK